MRWHLHFKHRKFDHDTHGNPRVDLFCLRPQRDFILQAPAAFSFFQLVLAASAGSSRFESLSAAFSRFDRHSAICGWPRGEKMMHQSSFIVSEHAQGVTVSAAVG